MLFWLWRERLMRHQVGMVRATLLMGGPVYALMIYFVFRKLTLNICVFNGGRSNAGMTTTDRALLILAIGPPVLLLFLTTVEWCIRVYRRKLPGHCRYCGRDEIALGTRCPACGTRQTVRTYAEPLFPVGRPVAKPYRIDGNSV
jgi:hypothetical protein